MESAQNQSYSRIEARRRLAAGNRWVVWNPNAQVVTEDHAKRMVVPSKPTFNRFRQVFGR
jgi:hypothetical protein